MYTCINIHAYICDESQQGTVKGEDEVAGITTEGEVWRWPVYNDTCVWNAIMNSLFCIFTKNIYFKGQRKKHIFVRILQSSHAVLDYRFFITDSTYLLIASLFRFSFFLWVCFVTLHVPKGTPFISIVYFVDVVLF